VKFFVAGPALQRALYDFFFDPGPSDSAEVLTDIEGFTRRVFVVKFELGSRATIFAFPAEHSDRSLFLFSSDLF
jgi:hypothetical protein